MDAPAAATATGTAHETGEITAMSDITALDDVNVDVKEHSKSQREAPETPCE